MPRGDRTGPEGAGPMTGRGAGYCGGSQSPGYANPGPWVGGGRGLRGRGRGWRHWFYATGVPGLGRFGAWAPTQEQEKQSRTARADWLGEQLEAVRARIEAIETKGE